MRKSHAECGSTCTL